MTISQIENELDNIGTIREKLLKPKKVQLHSGIEGFDSPDTFGVYRQNGGKPLGVVGKVFEPANLDLFLDSIINSINCCDNLDLSKLEYKELKGGSKIVFELPSSQFEVKSKLIGDVHQTKIQFMTGFDGFTKTSLSFFTLRLKCLNGAKAWVKEQDLSFKNTIGNSGKISYFGDQIVKVLSEQTEYNTFLNRLTELNITQSKIDTFMKKLIGYNQAEYKELTTRKRNILDKINKSVAIEQRDLGMNGYTLLQGITRYTTHELAEGNLDDLMFDTSERMNKTAHSILFEFANN